MITRRKARKILREGKARGKRLTDKQRRFFGARASGYPMRYGDGGTVIEAYEKGTNEQLWNAWDNNQRNHFLIDHADVMDLDTSVTEYAQKFSHAPWKDLPKSIKEEIAIHHAMGFYVNGGNAKPAPMKYLTSEKKKMLAKITSIRDRMKDIKDEKTLAAINTHLAKLEEALAVQIPTRAKIEAWKKDKALKRLSRK